MEIQIQPFVLYDNIVGVKRDSDHYPDDDEAVCDDGIAG
jgi:hypothetical protein